MHLDNSKRPLSEGSQTLSVAVPPGPSSSPSFAAPLSLRRDCDAKGSRRKAKHALFRRCSNLIAN